MNFRYRLMQFMSGRYGTDKFSYFILFFSAALSLINIFLRFRSLQLVVYAFIIYVAFRTLSRNIAARSNENKKFEDIVFYFKRKIDTHNQRKADTTHIYKKCPKCKAVLRLPRRIGKHTTICPKCNNSFRVHVKK